MPKQRTIRIFTDNNNPLILLTYDLTGYLMMQETKPEQQEISKLLKFSNDMADGAREIALQYYKKPKKQWTKSDSTFVTEADLRIEEFTIQMINEQYPEHGYFGEEYGDTSTDELLKWCIDPIDGTQPFVYGLPIFGVLIALTFNSRPIVGIIDSPAMGERWCGAYGFPTTWQGQVCSTKQNQALKDSVVFATSIDMFGEYERATFNHVSSLAKYRRFGADCYAYGLLASGYIDIVMEADMKPYDIMALVPVVEGADGVISDWSGNPLTLNSSRQVLATANLKLHEECLRAIQSN